MIVAIIKNVSMKKEEIKYLINQHLDDKLTPEEKEKLDNWINEKESNKKLFAELTEPKLLFEVAKGMYSFNKEIGWKNLRSKLFSKNEKK